MLLLVGMACCLFGLTLLLLVGMACCLFCLLFVWFGVVVVGWDGFVVELGWLSCCWFALHGLVVCLVWRCCWVIIVVGLALLLG